jgi:hypothetical protein
VVNGYYILVESGAFALQVDVAGSFETPTMIYQTTWHRIPEVCNLNFYLK